METAEQFNLFDIPASEPKKVRTKWQELQEMGAVWQEQGGLASPLIAASLLNVSKQRIQQLMDVGTLKRFDFFGKAYLSVKDIHAFVNSPRAVGVHVGATWKGTLRAVKERKK